MEKNPKANKPTNPKPNKAVIFILLIFTALIFFLVKLIFEGSSSATIGNYTKEDLPENFEYRIIKDESNPNVEKNQYQVEINQKLTEGQLATLAEELYNSKDKQRRFYIFYNLKDNENSILAWATSHFDPELEVSINGSTNTEDNQMLFKAQKVEGDIIGIFNEKDYTFSLYTIYEHNGKTFIRTTFKDGEFMDNEVEKINSKNGIRYNYKEDVSQGEYFVLNNDVLEFYNNDNKKFTHAVRWNKY
ncbi:hypothetical protein EG359_12085 [Chryseobacterium joostei]|uniref:Uncharacterized protein n=1 Tax=Chryseobacterium joostei TaxID=112234 RepID=A0A1N7IHL7_9FLAO|nr:hypothetical protein [Chryseobacterium joostei]AZB00312.1 hypothetical protein EG359_12085 [Chryseobacterium joostei]SIS36516.1 hypothetical protein SAMN05421768_105345 [Chryseobacterium joostei]